MNKILMILSGLIFSVAAQARSNMTCDQCGRAVNNDGKLISDLGCNRPLCLSSLGNELNESRLASVSAMNVAGSAQ